MVFVCFSKLYLLYGLVLWYFATDNLMGKILAYLFNLWRNSPARAYLFNEILSKCFLNVPNLIWCKICNVCPQVLSRRVTSRVPACVRLEKRDVAKCRQMRGRRLTVARYLAADSPNHHLAIWSPGCWASGHVVAVGRCAQPHLARHRRPDLRTHFTLSNPIDF